MGHGTYRIVGHGALPHRPIVLWSYMSHMSYMSQSHRPIVLSSHCPFCPFRPQCALRPHGESPMFKAKRAIAPGILLPTKTRFVIIAHLSLLFTVVSWIFLEPFMGNLYQYRTQLSLYETTMGKEQVVARMEDSPEKKTLIEKLARHAARFGALGPQEREEISRSYDKLILRDESSASEKVKGAFYTLCFSLSPYLRGWLLLSFAVCLFLLLRIEGGASASWLLLLLACFFAVDNQYKGVIPKPDPDTALFPTEQTLLKDYLHEEPASSINEQYAQLKRGWEQYLVTTWSPNKDLEEGEFRFNLARLKAWIEQPPEKEGAFPWKRSLWLLLPFCLWNLFFACFLNRRWALR